MDASRVSRWLIWTGPLFSVLLFVVDMLLAGNTPDEKASAAEVMKYFNDHQAQTLAGVFLAPLAAALLLVFAGEIRTRARERGAGGAGPTVMVSGAVLVAVAILAGAALSLSLETASDNNQPQIAETLNVLNADSWIPFIGGLAVFLIGAGMTVLSTRLLPVWLGWVGLVAGIVSLAGPGGFIGFFAAPLWILVAGIMLGVSSDRPVAPAPMAPSLA